MKKSNGKHRSDRPSGRQASEQPEHSGSAPSAESLHQGQGPDLISQDKRMQGKNQGVRQLNENQDAQKTGKPNQQPNEQSVREKLAERGEDLHDPESDM
jgi:hypothetical protein